MLPAQFVVPGLPEAPATAQAALGFVAAEPAGRLSRHPGEQLADGPRARAYRPVALAPFAFPSDVFDGPDDGKLRAYWEGVQNGGTPVPVPPVRPRPQTPYWELTRTNPWATDTQAAAAVVRERLAHAYRIASRELLPSEDDATPLMLQDGVNFALDPVENSKARLGEARTWAMTARACRRALCEACVELVVLPELPSTERTKANARARAWMDKLRDTRLCTVCTTTHHDLMALMEQHKREARARTFNTRANDLELCGPTSVMLDADDGSVVCGADGVPKLVRFRCEARLCPTCSRRRAAQTRYRLAPLLAAEGHEASSFVLMTMTRHDIVGESIEEASRQVMAALDIVRKSAWWKRNFRAALVAVEVTDSTPDSRARKASRSEDQARALYDAAGDSMCWDGDEPVPGPAWSSLTAAEKLHDSARKLRKSQDTTWHVHAHAVIVPRDKRLPFKARQAQRVELWNRWASALDVDATQCTVRLEAPRSTLEEVCKYVVKAADIAHMEGPRLVELVKWLEGRRVVRTWGDWYGRQDLVEAMTVDDGTSYREEVVPETEKMMGFNATTGELVPVARSVASSSPAALEAARELAARAWEKANRAPPKKIEGPPIPRHPPPFARPSPDDLYGPVAPSSDVLAVLDSHSPKAGARLFSLASVSTGSVVEDTRTEFEKLAPGFNLKASLTRMVDAKFEEAFVESFRTSGGATVFDVMDLGDDVTE